MFAFDLREESNPFNCGWEIMNILLLFKLLSLVYFAVFDSFIVCCLFMGFALKSRLFRF